MREYLPKQRVSGGLRLPAHKEASTAQPIAHDFVPARLRLSLHQHRGPAAEPTVAVGERVLRGQVVGRSDDSSWVHASSSGVVSAIEERLVPSFVGTATETCVVIECDGRNESVELQAQWPEDPEQQRLLIRQAGIVGLGGAVYPTELKLIDSSVATLVINGAECEPYISCDDMLMREAADEIVEGTLIMIELIDAPVGIIAIERDKPEAIDAIRDALDANGTDRVQLAELPTIYPAGGERQLISVLTGIEVPRGAFPSEIGFLCQNVGTARAVARVARHGEPLLSRVVTVAGTCVKAAANVEVPIGTPIAELIEFCGGYESGVSRLIHGGSMMGYALPSDDLPVTKATNCVIAAAPAEVRRDYTEWQCIRCGECGIACPVRLLPQDLLVAARTSDMTALAGLGLTDCIECGCCDVVCPSQIPLTEIFRDAKLAFADHAKQAELSAASDSRYQARATRQQKAEAAAREEQAMLRQTLESGSGDSHEAIEAAVERARQRRARD
jgi:electron transport complex protein RnfC